MPRIGEKTVSSRNGSEMGDTPQRTVSGTFECAVALTDRRSLKITGYFFNDDTPQDMNIRVDMAQDVLDRQSIRSDLMNKEAQIVGQMANLEGIEETYRGLVELTKKGHKLTSQQKLQMDNFEPSVKQVNKTINGLRAAIAAGRQKINGAAHA